jgi:hypothetical protein
MRLDRKKIKQFANEVIKIVVEVMVLAVIKRIRGGRFWK